MYFIKETAQISGVSVKTLHHYDKIGLLVPEKSENGYRVYSESDLERLQIILFYKYLGFPLGKIADLLGHSKGQRLPHLIRQLDYLQAERKHLDTLISTLQKTIQEEKGEVTMTISEKFQGFQQEDFAKYQDQAIEKYGQEAIAGTQARQKGREEEAAGAFNDVFAKLAANLAQGLGAQESSSQAEVDKLFQAMNTYAFDCSLQVFGYIGQGYVANPEFKKNIDKFGAGTAQYVAEAIEIYVKNKS